MPVCQHITFTLWKCFKNPWGWDWPPTEQPLACYKTHYSWNRLLLLVWTQWLPHQQAKMRAESCLPPFHFAWKKTWLVTAQYLQSIKPFWLSNWVSIARVVACFPQASLASTDSRKLRNSLCARPSYQPKLCQSAAPTAWPLILQSKLSIVFSNSLLEWLPDDRHWLAGAWPWTQTWTLPPDQSVVEVLSAQKPQNKVQTVWRLNTF